MSLKAMMQASAERPSAASSGPTGRCEQIRAWVRPAGARGIDLHSRHSGLGCCRPTAI